MNHPSLPLPLPLLPLSPLLPLLPSPSCPSAFLYHQMMVFLGSPRPSIFVSP